MTQLMYLFCCFHVPKSQHSVILIHVAATSPREIADIQVSDSSGELVAPSLMTSMHCSAHIHSCESLWSSWLSKKILGLLGDHGIPVSIRLSRENLLLLAADSLSSPSIPPAPASPAASAQPMKVGGSFWQSCRLLTQRKVPASTLLFCTLHLQSPRIQLPLISNCHKSSKVSQNLLEASLTLPQATFCLRLLFSQPALPSLPHQP